MDPYNHSTLISIKLPILDTRKFEQWKFRIQQCLQQEHYALWEVIEFDDSYKAPPDETTKDKGPAGKVSSSTKKKERTVAITTEDMQKRKNDVKERTTLYWPSLMNIKTLEQTFNRLQAIISHLEFMDVLVEQDDLNQKFLTSLPPEWLVYTIVWRNRDDLDTMSLDDVYNHLKVYEPEVQKRAGLNSQNMAFISSSNTSSGKNEVPTVQGASTASAQVPIVSTDVAAIDDDDIEEIDIKSNLALLSMRADRFWKKTGKKITIQGSDVAGFDKSKVECFNCHKMGHFGLSQVEARLVEFKENEIKYCEKIRVFERDIELKYNKIEYLRNELEEGKKEKESIDFKIENFKYASKDLDRLLGSQKLDKDMKGVGFNEYCAVLPPPTQVYSPPKKDLSWMGLPEFVDDTDTDYTRPTPRGSSSNVVPNPMIKFVKKSGCPNATKVNNTENARKPTVKYSEIPKIPTVGSKVPTAKPAVAADKGNKGKAVQALARWIWKPKQTSSDQGNISYLSEYEPFNRGYVSFGHGRGKITGKGSIKIGKLDFENVYFMEELKYNLFSVSQICDNKNSVLFTDTECLVLGKDFKLVDDKHVLLRTPRQQNMYTSDLKNVVPYKNLTCLIVKALVDESMLWHRRLGHLNFKTMNKLVRSNLVKGLPSKSFDNDHYCVACLKGKQHRLLTFFLKSKDETSRILRNFITDIKNLKDLKVKIIRSDNGGEFRNKEMDEFCSRKGIKREFSNARTPQQNGVVERRNRTLIEVTRTMVLVTKPHNKILCELYNERSLAIGFLRPFGCHVMILNTLDHLGKFDAKGDEGYFLGYSLSSKAFIVFNKRTKKIEENLHVDFLKNKSIEKGTGPDWLFDIDTLTNSMNYVPVVVAKTSSTNISSTNGTSNEAAKKDDAIPDNNSSQKEQQEVNGDKEVPDNSRNSNPTASLKVSANDSFELASGSTVETEVPTVSSLVLTNSLYVPPVTLSVPKIISRGGSSFQEPLSLGNAMSFENRLEDLFGNTSNAVSLNEVEADLSNLETDIQVSPTPTLRIHKDRPKSQIIGPVQTRHKTKDVDEQSFIAIIHQKSNPDLLQYCLFSCFLSQEEPKKIVDALKDPSWVEAMQQELLQFKI
nr:hypothetical protein [Tanacetum cinerariifolium]